jgi:hypothetical protein
MAAAVQTAPQVGQIRHLEITMPNGDTRHMSVEQTPGGYRLPFATLVNMWNLYSHMQGRTYLTVEAFLDDVHPGWQSWREDVPLPIMTNAQETAVVKAALKNAGIPGPSPSATTSARSSSSWAARRPGKESSCRSAIWPCRRSRMQ